MTSSYRISLRDTLDCGDPAQANKRTLTGFYPGDGVAPLKQVLCGLKSIGGTKVLLLELFNKTYWAQDPLVVAKTGLRKMKLLLNEIEG